MRYTCVSFVSLGVTDFFPFHIKSHGKSCQSMKTAFAHTGNHGCQYLITAPMPLVTSTKVYINEASYIHCLHYTGLFAVGFGDRDDGELLDISGFVLPVFPSFIGILFSLSSCSSYYLSFSGWIM